MIVRFDNKALQQSQDGKDIGVDGDPLSKSGGISEAEAIVGATKKHLDGGGEVPPLPLSRPSTNDVMEEVKQNQEPGPELNPAALEAARKKADAAMTETAAK